MFDFTAIDVETANSNYASICQMGIVGYSNGLIVKEYESLVNPEDYFDDINIEIHGIGPSDVRHSPTLPEIYHIVASFLEGNIVVCHTMFDKLALNRACNKYHLVPLSCSWLNSASIARRAWRQFARQGYSLLNLCEFLGYKFRHHDALEDAKAAGHIALNASRKEGIRVSDWRERIKLSPAQNVKRDGNVDGHLYGEAVVFTGGLSLCPRDVAAQKAAEAGCKVEQNPTKNTTILVLGDLDKRKLGGSDKSAKQRRVEKWISKGKQIRIIDEDAFWEMLTYASNGE
ncbi:MAG: hypothetical protein LBR94_08895 [Desulfovibrio sp.]|jgi:DNA polymerase-3 subunit epsilon|nr:hypothetical protein [Desulfovibrio sp.]